MYGSLNFERTNSFHERNGGFMILLRTYGQAHIYTSVDNWWVSVPNSKDCPTLVKMTIV
jgi:hypothetical protein